MVVNSLWLLRVLQASPEHLPKQPLLCYERSLEETAGERTGAALATAPLGPGQELLTQGPRPPERGSSDNIEGESRKREQLNSSATEII